jgi:hypothetical protein
MYAAGADAIANARSGAGVKERGTDLKSLLLGSKYSILKETAKDQDTTANFAPASVTDQFVTVAMNFLKHDALTTKLAGTNPAAESISSSKERKMPLATVEEYRDRFGTVKSIWGDWSPQQTRKFYKEHLPKVLLGKYDSIFRSN